MAHSTITGYWRQRGDGKATSFPALDLLVMPFEFTSSAKTSVSLGNLPKGAIPVGSQSWGGTATGGGAIAMHLGYSTASNGIANALPILTFSTIVANADANSELGNVLTAQTEVFGRATTATGGDRKSVV